MTQSASHWESAIKRTLSEITSAVEGVLVEAIALTAPAHNVVLVGEHGRPLRDVILWSDQRPAEVAARLSAHYGDAFFARTFVDLGPAWTFPQLVWLSEHEPGFLERVRHVLPAKDYLRWRMTGVVATDSTDAAGTAMYDPRADRWIDELIADAGLCQGALPPIRSATSTGGRLSDQWARYTGLVAGTPVTVGATDTAAELVSIGAVASGSGLIKIASTGTVVTVTDDPLVDRRLLTYPHATDAGWYTLAATSSAGVSHRWLHEEIFATGAGTEDAERDLATVPAGADGLLFLPFLDGERTPYWDPEMRGALLGMRAHHTRAHLVRAAMEGVAMSLRTCTELLERLGVKLDRPVLTGGGLQSPMWRQILLTVLDRSGVTVAPSGPAVGSARLAAVSVNHGRLDAHPFDASLETSLVEPSDNHRITYDELFAVYRDAVVATRDLHLRLGHPPTHVQLPSLT